MSDRIVLANMAFEGRHGVHDWERATPQPFEVDVELELDLAPAGTSDRLEETVDYGQVYRRCREIVEEGSYRLIEALAQAIAEALLAAHPVEAVVVRVRKPAVQLGGPLDHAMVEIRRARGGGAGGRPSQS
jgi:dihydroneopterin aldolase